MIKVLQIGLGPLGQKIGSYIADRKGITTVAAVDKNPNLISQDFGQLCDRTPSGITIKESVASALQTTKPDVVVLSTVSDLKRISQQIQEIVAFGIPIVSTCEELSYPWDCDRALANQMDQWAKEKEIAIVGTGVNPGFLMDALPTFLTAL